MKWDKIGIGFVSAVFAILLYALLPLESGKYKLKIVQEDSYFRMVGRTYHDLDGDGQCEILRYKIGNPVPAITVEGPRGEIVDQWNLNGDWLDNITEQLADIDQDGFAEMMTFTYFRDSIYLHVIEPLQEGGINLHIPVDRVALYNDHQDWIVNFGPPGDINGDGTEDIYFVIKAGFTLQPRKVYVLDGRRKALMIQEDSPGNNIAFPIHLDLDGDGAMEISGMVSSTGNFEGKDAYLSDTCAWLMVYDQDLKFKGAPVPFPGRSSYLHTLAVKKGGGDLLVSIHHRKTKNQIINRIEVREWRNDSLQVVAGRDFQSEYHIQLLCADNQSEGKFILADGGHLVWLDEFLNETKRLEVKEDVFTDNYLPLDINGDGVAEQVFYSDYSRLHVLQGDFRHGVELDLGYHESMPLISTFTRDHIHYINVFRGGLNTILSYSRNIFYPFRLLIPFVSFLLYFAIFSILLGMQKRRIESRQASERQILHYQLTNVVQQLDPHFLFNALSNISSFYHKGEKDHAQSYLAKVSRLVRNTLENSERISISLKEEISFVKDYLSVEQIRMGDRLAYSIALDEVLQEQIQIPKMLVQNFTENAVKHGIRHLKERKGMIRIYSHSGHGYAELVVEDNGVGRKRAAEMSGQGTGSGLVIIGKTLDIFEKLEKVKITFRIEDLEDQNKEPAGTRVILQIPQYQRKKG